MANIRTFTISFIILYFDIRINIKITLNDAISILKHWEKLEKKKTDSNGEESFLKNKAFEEKRLECSDNLRARLKVKHLFPVAKRHQCHYCDFVARSEAGLVIL